MHLLDSDIATLIYYGRNTKVLERYESFPLTDRLVLSVVTRVEILSGRYASLLKAATSSDWLTAQARLKEVESWVSRFEAIEITDSTISRFEELRPQRKLKKIGHRDLLIACIALAHDATLVTRRQGLQAHHQPPRRELARLNGDFHHAATPAEVRFRRAALQCNM